MSEIKQYFELLEQLVKEEQRRFKESDQRFYKKNKWFLCLQTICVTCVGIGTFLWVFAYTQAYWLKGIAGLFLAVAFLSFVLTLMIMIYKKGTALTVATDYGQVDYKYLSLLMSLSTQTLELGCLELEHGRNWFVKGLSVFVGVIDKVGLIPSVLSLAALYAIPDKLPEWATPIVIACALLYFICIIFQERLTRLERLIDLTQLALKLKEKNKS